MQKNSRPEFLASKSERLAYTIDEFMAVTGFPRNKTYAALASGRLKSFRDGRRVFISAEAAKNFIAKLERETDAGEQ